MKIQRIYFVVAAVVLALLNSAVSAGTILNAPAPAVSGPGLGFAAVALIATLSPNNDNVPAAGVPDNNITVPLKRFDFADYIDIEFSVAPSNGGVTEYQVSEFVDNNTGSPWSSYRMVLGTGTGAGFVISALNDGLDFDAPTYDTPPTSVPFPTVNAPDEDQLVFSGGSHGNGAQPYSFRIDVPDMDRGVVLGHFTLRQIPTAVPEPASLAIWSLLGLVGFRCRRGQKTTPAG